MKTDNTNGCNCSSVPLVSMCVIQLVGHKEDNNSLLVREFESTVLLITLLAGNYGKSAEVLNNDHIGSVCKEIFSIPICLI